MYKRKLKGEKLNINYDENIKTGIFTFILIGVALLVISFFTSTETMTQTSIISGVILISVGFIIDAINLQTFHQNYKKKYPYILFAISYRNQYYFEGNEKELYTSSNTVLLKIENDNMNIDDTIFRETVYKKINKELMSFMVHHDLEIISIDKIKEVEY